MFGTPDFEGDNVLSFAEFNSFLRVLKNQDLGRGCRFRERRGVAGPMLLRSMLKGLCLVCKLSRVCRVQDLAASTCDDFGVAVVLCSEGCRKEARQTKMDATARDIGATCLQKQR